MKITQSFLTENPCYKRNQKMEVRGLLLYCVGCPQPAAKAFVSSWNHPESNACVHAFIDGNTGEVYQTLPWEYKGWHGEDKANDTHISIELCEPSNIQYTEGTKFVCTEKASAVAVVKRTYDAAVELSAMLCKKFALETSSILSSKEGRIQGISSGNGTPEHLWDGLETEYTMESFRNAVADAMTEKKIIQAGDFVKMVPDAIYYTQKEVPAWVLGDTWIVKAVNGDKVIIDKNVSGTSSINSPIHISQLILVTNTVKTEQTAATVPTEISQRGVALIAKYEGCRLEAYQCAGGTWTIGYGHTAGVKPGDTLPSQEYAKALLKEDLALYVASVNKYIKDGTITFTPTQNQFDALVSLCYNLGAGGLKGMVEGKSAMEVAEIIPSYNKAGGKVLQGLVRRREEEKALFLS